MIEALSRVPLLFVARAAAGVPWIYGIRLFASLLIRGDPAEKLREGRLSLAFKGAGVQKALREHNDLLADRIQDEIHRTVEVELLHDVRSVRLHGIRA
jgi:hypothetical protein